MSLSYSVSIPQLPDLQKAFQRAPEATKSAITTAINKSLVGYQATAKQLAPFDKGALRGSIQISPASWSGNTGKGSVGTNLNYAVYQETGTGIYGPRHTPITPKTKPVLSWYSGGKWHFAKSVKGSRPRWYMKGSVEQNQSKTEGYFQQALDQVAQQLARSA
jgi:hypothetical protein